MDTNSIVAGLLRDLSTIQASKHGQLGYKRAAAAILHLDQPLEALAGPDGSLPKIPMVGPSSLRVIHEVLRTGASPTAERLIAASGREREVTKARAFREQYLSRAQVLAALGNRRLKGPRLEDYRGDLQMHSVWSDGSEPLQQIIESCLARGQSYCAITDHSYGLPIANGVSFERLREQHREIDRLNKLYKGRFRMLKGIEANIRGDGSIDMTREELATLEIVVASPHSQLRTIDDQTTRMVAAVSAPGVHILGHPRGRKYSTRPGVSADWKAVFAAAADRQVAIEIDGDPSRQDLDWTLAKDAARAGCLIALDSDAHASRELDYSVYAIAHARLAGVPKERVINCWPIDKLVDWSSRLRA